MNRYVILNGANEQKVTNSVSYKDSMIDIERNREKMKKNSKIFWTRIRHEWLDGHVAGDTLNTYGAHNRNDNINTLAKTNKLS